MTGKTIAILSGTGGAVALALALTLSGATSVSPPRPLPYATALRETSGPTTLTVGAVVNGEYLKRVGTTVVSAAIAAPSDASTIAKGIVQLAGNLGGVAATPTVTGITETAGPTSLTIGAVSAGQFLTRTGGTVVGAAIISGRHIPVLSSPQTILAGGGTVALGQVWFDPSWVPAGKSLRLGGVARVSDAAEDGAIDLWDLVAAEAITGGLDYTGSLDTLHDSAALTVGAGAGEVKLAAQLYEIRATMSGAAPGYMAISNVYLEVY